ncbi:hypothetical protein [Mucilaginibacter agri]|uniref:Uncharacterized protein n=1 Tax=Mucilaginibacter agri TaxID=2695265 RepID=A0A965ZHF2_9SPHI|nr:hypothetical protein [Mucilaginibacter agri]NCD71148.1 hypothetical protein [Mucilaginibacter agri]
MKHQIQAQLLLRAKTCIWIMIVGLALSGLTAFPIETELKWLLNYADTLPTLWGQWLHNVYGAVVATNKNYPYLSYGTDWLAFAHLILALLFVGPLNNPVKNVWVIEFGIIACLLIIPLAFIAGSIRHIPVFWRVVDCMFCLLGIIPLIICYKSIKLLQYVKVRAL